MNNTLNIQRLLISLKEFWEFNRLKLSLIPIAVIIGYMAYFLWPDRYLNIVIFHPKLLDEGLYTFYNLLNNNKIDTRLLVFLLIPIFILACSNTYLKNQNKSIRATLIPISITEKIFTLYLYSLVIALVIIAVFFALDWVFLNYMKTTYLDRINEINMENGFPYKTYGFGSYFVTVESKHVYATLLLTFLLIPFYHLSMVFFKKNSFIYTAALYLLLLVSSVAILIKIHNSRSVNVYDIDNMYAIINNVILTLLVYGLLILAFYNKLKEKQL